MASDVQCNQQQFKTEYDDNGDSYQQQDSQDGDQQQYDGDSQNDNGDDCDQSQEQNQGRQGNRNSNNSSMTGPKYIRLRGLPWSATHKEILDFLSNVKVVNGVKGIHLVTSRWDGKNTGEAFVEVESQEDVDEAHTLNKKCMGHRYIEIFNANAKEAHQSIKKPGGVNTSFVVKCRGLPYEITEANIEAFFGGLDIKPDREGIVLVLDKRGRATGEAFVQFESLEDTEQALGLNREKIGHRYIEIFRSSLAELRRSVGGGGRVGPYDLKDRGGNRGGSDYGGGRNNMRGGGNDWGNNGGFGVGANNTLGYSSMGFSNTGNFGNGNSGGGGGGFGGNNGGGFGGNGGGYGGGGGGGNGNFGGNGNGNGNFGNGYGANNMLGGGGGGIGGGIGGAIGGGIGAGIGGGLGNRDSGIGGGNRFNNGGGGGGGGGGGNFGNDFGDFGNFGNNRNNFNNAGNFNGGGNMGGGNFGGGNFGGNAPGNMSGGGGGVGGGIGGGMGGFNAIAGGGGNNFGPIGGGRNNDNEYYSVHMRGLPYSAYENDIFKFFDPVRPANIRVNFNKKGLHSGTADAFFDTYDDAQLVMKKHKSEMGSRYIEMFFDGKVPARGGGGGGGGGGGSIDGGNGGGNFNRRF